MKIKPYVVFAMVGIASGIVAFGRLALGHDVQDVIYPNIVIGSVCVSCMYLLLIKERRKNNENCNSRYIN